jgi:hypothetical protein
VCAGGLFSCVRVLGAAVRVAGIGPLLALGANVGVLTNGWCFFTETLKCPETLNTPSLLLCLCFTGSVVVTPNQLRIHTCPHALVPVSTTQHNPQCLTAPQDLPKKSLTPAASPGLNAKTLNHTTPHRKVIRKGCVGMRKKSSQLWPLSCVLDMHRVVRHVCTPDCQLGSHGSAHFSPSPPPVLIRAQTDLQTSICAFVAASGHIYALFVHLYQAVKSAAQLLSPLEPTSEAAAAAMLLRLLTPSRQKQVALLLLP